MRFCFRLLYLDNLKCLDAIAFVSWHIVSSKVEIVFWCSSTMSGLNEENTHWRSDDMIVQPGRRKFHILVSQQIYESYDPLSQYFQNVVMPLLVSCQSWRGPTVIQRMLVCLYGTAQWTFVRVRLFPTEEIWSSGKLLLESFPNKWEKHARQQGADHCWPLFDRRSVEGLVDRWEQLSLDYERQNVLNCPGQLFGLQRMYRWRLGWFSFKQRVERDVVAWWELPNVSQVIVVVLFENITKTETKFLRCHLQRGNAVSTLVRWELKKFGSARTIWKLDPIIHSIDNDGVEVQLDPSIREIVYTQIEVELWWNVNFQNFQLQLL